MESREWLAAARLAEDYTLIMCAVRVFTDAINADGVTDSLVGSRAGPISRRRSGTPLHRRRGTSPRPFIYCATR